MPIATIAAPEVPESASVVPVKNGEMLRVIFVGLAVGVLAPLFTWLLSKFFIDPVFCHQGGNMGICGSGGVVANHIAVVFLTIVAFAFLNHSAIYRALLLALASGISMWGLQKYASSLTAFGGIEYYLFSALLYSLAYATFFWVLRLRAFAIAVAILAVVLGVTCWVWVS